MMPTVILENALTHPPKVCTGVQVTNVITWMAARKFPLENHAVGIIGIMVRPHPCRLSPSQCGQFVPQSIALSLGRPRQWLYLPSPHCPLK